MIYIFKVLDIELCKKIENIHICNRYYTVQQSENSGPFQTIPERVDPSLTSYTANNLKPFTLYQFRIQATNDIGPSDWSTESIPVQTLPAGV